MNLKTILFVSTTSFFLPGLAAADITVHMYEVSATGSGAELGTVVISKAAHGLEFTPALMGLPPGEHGFHVHEVASCEPGEDEGMPAAAMAAGPHYDPEQSGKHSSPTLDGHMGDLPVLVVDASGNATEAVVAHRLAFENVTERALMIHAGGDNYSDEPLPAGGGGARIACGVIELAIE